MQFQENKANAQKVQTLLLRKALCNGDTLILQD